jgi:hypothetical protein
MTSRERVRRAVQIRTAYSTPETVGQTPERLAAMCAAFREYEAGAGEAEPREGDGDHA